MSTIMDGAARRMDSSGTRLCPPASTFASGFAASTSRASAKEAGRANSNGAGFTSDQSPLSVEGPRRLLGALAAVVPATVDQVEVDDHKDRAERDASELEVVRDLQSDATDAGDQATGEADHVHRVAEVDAVLHP